MKHIARFTLILLIINPISPIQSWAQQIDPRLPVFPEPEIEQAALEFIETYHPSRIEEIRRMKIANPKLYAEAITDIWRQTEKLKILQKEDPERYDIHIRQEILDEKTFVLSQSYQAAKDKKEKQSIKAQLEAEVSEQFDLREQIKEWEVKEMEAELQRVRETLKQRKENKKKIVKLRVDQLLNMSAGLEWE